jgi:lipoate---protein ligase
MKRLPLKVFVSDSHNPWFNLATEDWIFRDMDPAQRVLFLWRNSDTVVIGRFQNPWKECNTKAMEADGVLLARRQSGGGAVFQDLGNTNFTFMSGRESYEKTQNNHIILKALDKFSLKAETSGRNDLVLPDAEGVRKFSGSAFKETKDRCFHHGTLLINANLQKLANYLNPDEKKLKSKGIESVRSRVVNLTELVPELNHELVSEQIIREFCDYYQDDAERIALKTSDLEQIPRLKKYYDQLRDWNWRFGETPQFEHELNERLSFGGVELHIDTHKGLINQVTLYSDSLHPEMIESLATSLVGKVYTGSSVREGLEPLKAELPMFTSEIDEFANWLSTQIQ